MVPYQVRTSTIKGKSRFSDIGKEAMFIFRQIEKRTKRQPYLRSAYFNKEKIFFTFFFKHLNQKPVYARPARLKLLPCAIELIEESHNKPIERLNPNRKTEKFYRFAGLTPQKHLFYVQIKENLKTKKKYFMSCFLEK